METPRPRTRSEIKVMAQTVIMDQIAKTLGYYEPHENGHSLSVADTEAFHAELRKQADRVARILGYEEAWTA